MKILEILVGKRGYDIGISSRLQRIRVVRIQRGIDSCLKYTIDRGVHTLHLVIYHAVAEELAVLIRLVVPALLTEYLLLVINPRIKYRIEIHVHQIGEVLVIAARHRIYGLVRIGHGIEKGIERALG